MELFDAIHQRQSIGKVKPDPVPRELIEQILAAAVQAPNHHTVRPWRFVVLTGGAREQLGAIMAESLHQLKPDLPEAGLNAERAKPLRSPVLIAVGVDKPVEPKVVEIENICAVAAACQNILLAAQGLGLAAMWRTGAPATDPNVKKFLGFEADQHIIAFIYIGYPLNELAPTHRPSFEDRTIWKES
jgi:nitroreductase